MVVHILCDAIELYLHVCSRVIYRSLTQATIIHACVGSIGWGRSRNLHKGPHKREYFGKGSLEQWMSNGIIRHLIIMTSQYNIFRAK